MTSEQEGYKPFRLNEIGTEALGSPGAGSLSVPKPEQVLRHVTLTPEMSPPQQRRLFLERNTVIGLHQQLGVMRDFWRELGYDMPALNEEQTAHLGKRLELNPAHRVVPAPFLDLAGRRELNDRARIFPRHRILDTHERYIIPEPSSMDYWPLMRAYSTLLDDPSTTVQENTYKYVLRYQAPGGQLLSRDAYLEELLRGGRAIGGRLVWGFPVMKVNASPPIKTEPASAMVHAEVSPESVFAVRLLHLAGNTMQDDWVETDVVNEIVCNQSPHRLSDSLWVPLVKWMLKSEGHGISLSGASGDQIGNYTNRHPRSGLSPH